MAMGVMRPPMFAAIIVSVVLGVTCWVVTAPRWGVGAGAEGLAWAFVFSTYVGAFSLVFISWSLMVRKYIDQMDVPLIAVQLDQLFIIILSLFHYFDFRC
jgi:hypothetical protein